jgi:hypothetical protein
MGAATCRQVGMKTQYVSYRYVFCMAVNLNSACTCFFVTLSTIHIKLQLDLICVKFIKLTRNIICLAAPLFIPESSQQFWIQFGIEYRDLSHEKWTWDLEHRMLEVSIGQGLWRRKTGRMRWARGGCGAHGGDEGCIQHFYWGAWRKETTRKT